MVDQEINEDGDIIQNVEDGSWERGSCPPLWTTLRIHSDPYNEVYN